MKIECKKCGECCRKGGPGLHLADKALIERGVIERRRMLTLRAGELVFDNVSGEVVPLAAEMVKIRNAPGDSACIFLEGEATCSIYEDRPSECRVMFCQDTSEIEAVYDTLRLNRSGLVNTEGGLFELLVHHEEQCSHERAASLAVAADKGDEDALAALKDMAAFDENLRRLLVERAGADPEELPFLLGRPMAETIRARGGRLKFLF